MNELKWETDKNPIDKDVIEKYENELNVIFPQSYKNITMKYHGGYPDKVCYDLKFEKEKMIGNLLNFDNDDDDDLLLNFQLIRERLKKGIIPFAIDPFGNFICFQYTSSNDEPNIVFWDHEIAFDNVEKAISNVCASFDDFLDMLYLPED